MLRIEQIDISDKVDDPILNLKDFVERQESIEEYMQICKFRRKNHLKLLDKILKLEEVLSKYFWQRIDPIIYLNKLYREENLSIDSIVKKLKGIYDEVWETKYFYKISTSLQAFFKWVLNWELKNSKKSKTTQTYKSREKPIELVKKNQEEKDKRIALFLSWYIINSKPDKINFDSNIFEWFRFKYEKFIYLLENFFNISKNSYQKLLEIELWNQSFADRFNEIFKDNNIDFEISHKDIARVFEKYK